MIKRLLMLMLMLGVGMAAPAAAKPIPKIIIEVGAGHAFSIELPSQQRRGYYWRLARPLESNMLELTGARYLRHPDKTSPDAEGTEVWSFRSLAPGLSEIHFEYRSGYDNARQPNRIRIYQIMMWDRHPDRVPAPGHGPEGEPDQDPDS